MVDELKTITVRFTSRHIKVSKLHDLIHQIPDDFILTQNNEGNFSISKQQNGNVTLLGFINIAKEQIQFICLVFST